MTNQPIDVAVAGRARAHGDDTGVGSPPRMPRWVMALGILVGILALLSVLRLAGLGPIHGGHTHGPGRPPASGAPGGHAPGGGH